MVVDAAEVDTQAGALRIFPNPAGSMVTVDCSQLQETPQSIRVIDWAGRVVLDEQAGLSEQHTLSLETLPAGTYNIQVQLKTGSVVRRLVKM